nr:Fe-S cluster assembly protein SufD [Chiayiivirga flava]
MPLRDAAGLGVLRRDALAGARRAGLPGARAERWKYTSLRALERRRFAPVTDIAKVAIALPPTPRMVFVNGRLDADRTDLAGLPYGVRVLPLSSALGSDPSIADLFLARRFTSGDEAFAQLNTALATEGAVVRVEACAPTTTLHLVFIGADGGGADRAWHLRNLVDLQAGACLQLVEHHVATAAHAHLSNTITQLHLRDNARLAHARVQQEAVGATALLRTEAALERDATYRRLDLELGAALSRHELNVALRGEGARLHAHGALLGDGRRLVDTRLGIEHVARDTACELVYRGIASGRGRVAFHGGILIRAGADGTDANLSNKNLLLSDQAEIDTQPVLEIHADEVKAAHGATVGNLDAAALFYLRARGIPEAPARSMLTAAFLRETLAVLDADLRGTVAPALDAALERGAAGPGA